MRYKYPRTYHLPFSPGGTSDDKILLNDEHLNGIEVVVTEKTDGNALVLEVKVADSDMGKVIGKQGRIAKAIRAVVKAAAAKEDKKVIVDIA